MNHNEEKTFLMLKPDCVKRKLVGEIISRFERKGFNMLHMAKLTPTRKMLEAHYAEHKDKPFFEELILFMLSGDVVAMVWEGVDIINVSRGMMGTSYPEQPAPGTIRGDYAPTRRHNLIHGSDSVEAAKREINIWVHGYIQRV